jgi:ribonuclease P protein component
LRRSADFDRVQRNGRRVHGRNLVVVHLANDLGNPRFGLSVGRKVGTAVVRNRVKRWLREAVRRQRAGVPAVDIVLIARPSAAAAGYHALFEEIGAALARIPGSGDPPAPAGTAFPRKEMR